MYRVGADVDALQRVIRIVPDPLARHRGIFEAGHGQALDHSAGTDHFLAGRRRVVGHLLAVGQLLDGGLAADLQLRGLDGEGDLLGRVRVAVRPHALPGIAQLQDDLVIARIRAALVGLHGVIGGIVEVRRVMLAVVGHGRDLGNLRRLLDHVQCHDGFGIFAIVKIRAIRRESDLITVGAQRVQAGVRDGPSEGSLQIAFPRSIGRQLVRDVVQVGADRNVILQRPADTCHRRYNLHGKLVGRSVEEIRTVVIVCMAMNNFVPERNLYVGRARHVAILLDHIILRCNCTDQIDIIPLHVFKQVVPIDIALDQFASHISHRFTVNEAQYANLRLYEQLRLGGAIRMGVCGREDKLSGDIVVLTLEPGGGIRPREGAGHRVAAGIDGLAVRSQLHRFEFRAPGEEFADRFYILVTETVEVGAGQGIRVVDRHVEGHAALVELQGDVLLDEAAGIAEVVGEGDGDLRGAGVAGVALRKRLRQFHLQLKQAEIEIGLAGFVRRQRAPKQRFDVRRIELRGIIINVVHLQRQLIHHMALRRREDVLDGRRQLPVGRIAAHAHGAGGDDHRLGRLREVRAGPAREDIAAAGWVAQLDVLALDVVGFGVRAGRRTSGEVVAEGIFDGFPLGGQGDFAGGAFGNVPFDRIAVFISRRFRCLQIRTLIALAGGIHEYDRLILDGVGRGVGGIVFRAVQLIVDGVLHEFHARIQRHVALDDIIRLPDLILILTGRREIPADELIASRHRHILIFDPILNLIANHLLIRQVFAIGEDVGHICNLLPAGIEGDASFEDVVREVHRHAGAIGREIPAGAAVAFHIRRNRHPHRIIQALPAVGIASVQARIGFAGLRQEGVFPAADRSVVGHVGDMLRSAHMAVEIHGHVHGPAGLQHNIIDERLIEVEGLFTNCAGVIPIAIEGQTVDLRRGGRFNQAIFVRADAAIDVRTVAAVHEDRAIDRFGVQLNLQILRRHGEGDAVVLPVCVIQSCAIGADGQVLRRIDLCTIGIDAELRSGHDGAEFNHAISIFVIRNRIVLVVVDRDSSIEGILVHERDGEISGEGIQHVQFVYVAFLVSGDAQAAIVIFAVGALHQNRVLRLYLREYGALHGQAPAVLLALHRLEAQRSDRAVVGLHGEGNVLRHRIRRSEDVGDLPGEAADIHRHLFGHGLIMLQILRGEAQRAALRAHLAQAGGGSGLDPGEAAFQRFSRSRLGRQVEGHVDQQFVVIGVVLLRAHNLRGRAGDDEDQPGLRVEQHVLVGIVGHAVNLDGFIARQFDVGHAGLEAGLHKLRTGEFHGRVGRVEPIAGHCVDRVDIVLGFLQVAAHVFDGVFPDCDGLAQLNDEVHAGLGVDRNPGFRDAVSRGIVGREHDPIDRLIVVRAHGNDVSIRPGEAALHGFALKGRRAGQVYILQARIVGDEAAALGVYGAHVEGYGVLLNPERDALVPGKDVAVILVEGHRDLRGPGIRGVVLVHIVGQFGLEAKLVDVGRAGFVRSDLRHGGGLEVRNAVVILRVHDEGIRNGVQRGLQDVAGGVVVEFPVGGVAAVSGGTGGQHNVQGRLGEIRAGPAGEDIAGADGIAQRNFAILDGVGRGNGRGQRAVGQITVERIVDDLPVGGQGDVALVACGDGHRAVDGFDALCSPAEEGIARAGGIADDNLAALVVVAGGVGGIVLAAVQRVGDEVLLRHPTRVQRHGTFDDVALQFNAIFRIGGRRAEPAQEAVAVALRSLGDVAQGHAHIFQRHAIGRIRLAVVEIVGQNGGALPAGVEGHAFGEDVARGIHGIARKVRTGIPADELAARVVGQHALQRGFARLPGGVGEAGIAGFVAGEDQLDVGEFEVLAVDVHVPAAGDMGRLSLRAAEVHGNLDLPAGVEGGVCDNRLREVEGFARAVGVVVPAREDQIALRRIGRRFDGCILLHVNAGIEAQAAVVVHEIHIVDVYAVEGEAYVAVRHDEAERTGVGAVGRIGILQPLGFGAGAHVLVTILHFDGDGDPFAGRDGLQRERIVGNGIPGHNTLAGGDLHSSGHAAQRQRDHIPGLAAGDGQSAFDGVHAAALEENRVGSLIEGGAVHGQAPAVRFARHGLEGQRLNGAVVGADGERHVVRRVGDIQNIGNLSGIADDVDLHVDDHGLIVVQILRGEAQLEALLAHLAQAGGGVAPCEAALHFGSVRRLRPQVEGDVVQQRIVLGVIAAIAGDLRSCKGDGDVRAGRGVDQGVQVVAGHAGNHKRFIALQGNGGRAGLIAALAQQRAIEGDGRVELLPGRNVHHMERAFGNIQRAPRVGDGFGQREAELQSDLRIDGDQRFRRRVGMGILRREHDAVDGPAVVRALGHDGRIRPCEAALHFRAVPAGRASQFHIFKGRAVGDVAAADGVGGGHIEGHGVLFDPQHNSAALGGGVAVVLGVADGDLHRPGQGGVILVHVADDFGFEAEAFNIGRTDFIRRDLLHGSGLEVRDLGVIVHAHDKRIPDGVQRGIQDIVGVPDGSPVGGVAAVSEGTGGDFDLQGRPGQIRAGPAGEDIARARGIVQHNLCAVGIVAGGVGLVVHAAVEFVGDGIVHRLPARVQGHTARGNVFVEPDAFARLAGRGAIPAGKDIVFALRILGNAAELRARVFQGHIVGLFIVAVIEFVGQYGDLIPLGVEGHAAGEDVFLGLHGLAGAARVGVPAFKLVALIGGQRIFQSLLTQHMGGIGVAVILRFVAGEDQLRIDDFNILDILGLFPFFAFPADVDFHVPAAGDIGRLSLRAAEVHSDLDLPAGVQGGVPGNLLAEVEGFARAFGVVVPAREDQAVYKGRGRLCDAGVAHHRPAGVAALVAVVVHKVHVVALRAVEGQPEIAERHGEGERTHLGGDGLIAILHPRRVGDGAHARIASRQIDPDRDLVAGRDCAHIADVVGDRIPAGNALAQNDIDLPGRAVQVQRDHILRLASGDDQVGGNAVAAARAEPDGLLRAVKGRAGNAQAPALRIGSRQALEGHRMSVIGAAHREYGVVLRIGRFDNIGNLSGVAVEALYIQVEVQIVFHRGRVQVVAHRVAPGRDIAGIAEARNAKLRGEIDVVSGGVEPGEGHILHLGIARPGLGDEGVEGDFARGRGLHGAAQHMGIFEGGRVQGFAIPIGRFDAPGVGAPVVQREVHVDGDGGHLELAGEVEHLPVMLDQLGLVPVFIGQHHVAVVERDLVGGGRHFVRVDDAGLALHAVARVNHVHARVVGRNRLAVDVDVLQRKLRGDVARLQGVKQQLPVAAFARVHVVGDNRQIFEDIARPAVDVLHRQIPHLVQRVLLHDAHGHAPVQGIQIPAIVPEGRAHIEGEEEEVQFEAHVEVEIHADLQIHCARIVAPSGRGGSLMHEHARQLHIGIECACKFIRSNDGETEVEGHGDAHAHAELTDQVNLAGHVAGQLLLVVAALHLLEVEVEAHPGAVFRRDGHAEGGDARRLAHEFEHAADGDDAVTESLLDSQQPYGEQILIIQLRIHQLTHTDAQLLGRPVVIIIVHGRAGGGDDLLQRFSRDANVVEVIAGGRAEFQTDGRLGGELHGSVHPQPVAVHVDVQGQPLLEEQTGCEHGQNALLTDQLDRAAHIDAGDEGISLRGQDGIRIDVGEVGLRRGQGVGARAVGVVQEFLGIAAGHHGHQHLRLQLLVGGELGGDALFGLVELLLCQLLRQVHLLGGVNVQIGEVILGIGVAEGDVARAVRSRFHGVNLRVEHIARQIAALPVHDVVFVPAEIAVVEHDDLTRLQIDVAGQNQAAGNDRALGVIVSQHVIDGNLGSGGRFRGRFRLGHGGVIGHVVPQDVGQPLRELDNSGFLAEDAHRQRVDVFRLIGKLHAVLRGQGEGEAGGEARFAVDFRAVFGFAHGDFGGFAASTGLHAEVCKRFIRTHALGQNQADGGTSVGKLNGGGGVVLLLLDLLIGGEIGIERHALFDGVGVAEARGAFLIHAPAAEGIALLVGVELLYRLGQQVFAFGKGQRLQLKASEGFEGNDNRVRFIDEAGVERHLTIHGRQTGRGGGVVRVLIPGGKDLALARGGRRIEVHHAAGRDFLGRDSRALGDEGHQPLGQHKVHLLAGLQLDDLGVGAGHFKSDFGLIDDGGGGAHGQGADGFLHANHAQRAAALDDDFIGLLYDNFGKGGIRIHMEVDQTGLSRFLRLRRFICLRRFVGLLRFPNRGIADMYAGNFALVQIHAARGVQGERLGLDPDQGQVLRLRDREALRLHRVDGEIVAENGDAAQLLLAREGVDGILGIDRGRECRLHPLHVFLNRDGGGGIDLRRFLGQNAVFRQDGQVDAVILEAQIRYAIRIRVQINVGCVLDDKAQHAGDLFAGLRPAGFPVEGIHIPARRPADAEGFGQARDAAGGEDCDHKNRREESSHQCLHF